MTEDPDEARNEDGGELNDGIRVALSRLDGSPRSAVALLAGVSPGALDEYGGLPAGRS